MGSGNERCASVSRGPMGYDKENSRLGMGRHDSRRKQFIGPSKKRTTAPPPLHHHHHLDLANMSRAAPLLHHVSAHAAPRMPSALLLRCAPGPSTRRPVHPVRPQPLTASLTRAFHTSSPRCAAPIVTLKPTGKQPFESVRLRFMQADGTLAVSPPRPIADVHTSYNPETHALIVHERDRGTLTSGHPIVEIHERQLLERQSAQARTKSKTARTPQLKTDDKLLQLRWSSGEADVDRTVENACALLARGQRVAITVMHRGRAAVSTQERSRLIQKFAEGLQGVGEQWKPVERTGAGLAERAAMYWQPLPAVRKAAQQHHKEQGDQKREAKKAADEGKKERHLKRMVELEKKKQEQAEEAQKVLEESRKAAAELWGDVGTTTTAAAPPVAQSAPRQQRTTPQGSFRPSSPRR